MDKHWMIFRESDRKQLGEDFGNRMPDPEGVTERSARVSHWQQRIIQGLTQTFVGSDDLIPEVGPLRHDA